MNRLVIIGNGFDLAHGLPTGYSHFINWYWKRLIRGIELFPNESYKKQTYEDEMIKIYFKFKINFPEDMESIEDEFSELKTYLDLKNFIAKRKLSESAASELRYYKYDIDEANINDCSLEFKNSFFKSICDKQYIQNWVDIENEYYQLLKECLKEEDNWKVKKLNEEFEQVKKLLEEYLTTGIEDKYEFSTNIEINDIFSKRLYNKLDRKMFLREIEKPRLSKISVDPDVVTVYKTLLLSFNYTNLTQKYLEILLKKNIKTGYGDGFEKNQIHGELNNKDNLINFGFGDEMDDDYKTIEKKDDNEYLRNIKSFAYLNTPNYKNLIDFLELKEFQVYIMGHSCGLSDRILLNKVFEHKNCISIKIYYYQNGDWDNYTDIAQNVSRHFNKKEMMRERIVNKTYCEPLPQTKLPLKDTSASSV